MNYGMLGLMAALNLFTALEFGFVRHDWAHGVVFACYAVACVAFMFVPKGVA